MKILNNIAFFATWIAILLLPFAVFEFLLSRKYELFICVVPFYVEIIFFIYLSSWLILKSKERTTRVVQIKCMLCENKMLCENNYELLPQHCCYCGKELQGITIEVWNELQKQMWN